MIFANVKTLSIPEGVVEKITVDGRVLWQLIKAKYTNQIPISTDTSGNIYNGKGYKEKTYINAGTEGANNTTCTTGFIPCTPTSVIRLKNMPFNTSISQCRLTFYTSSKAYIGQVVVAGSWYLGTEFKGVKDADGNYIEWTLKSIANVTANCAYVRITAITIDSTSVVTINEEIA